LRGSLTDGLHGEVAAMNRENFIVRMHLEAVERFQNRGAWERLSERPGDAATRGGGPASEIATDDIESRLFDLTALRMQLALVEGTRARSRAPQAGGRDRHAAGGEGRHSGGAAQLEYLAGHAGNRLLGRHDARRAGGNAPAAAGAGPFLDKKKRKIVYTDFRTRCWGAGRGSGLHPKMTGAQYEKKVNDYLRNHLDHIVIHRLRTNQPLTEPT
jgi:type I restriction enzyme, R subunit